MVRVSTHPAEHPSVIDEARPSVELIEPPLPVQKSSPLVSRLYSSVLQGFTADLPGVKVIRSGSGFGKKPLLQVFEHLRVGLHHGSAAARQTPPLTILVNRSLWTQSRLGLVKVVRARSIYRSDLRPLENATVQVPEGREHVIKDTRNSRRPSGSSTVHPSCSPSPCALSPALFVRQ